MKRILTIISAIVCISLTLFTLASCGKDFKAAEWSENNGKTKRSASYKELNDEKYYEIDVDEKITMSISVGTVSGDAFFAEIYNVKTPDAPIYTLVIHREEDKLIANVNYGGKESITELSSDYSETITIAGEKDDFVIHIKGQNHTGSFVFDW